MVYEAALLARIQCRPCSFVYQASIKGGFEDVLSEKEEYHKKLYLLVRAQRYRREENLTRTMAKTRPECLIIGDKMTLGRSRKPGSGCLIDCVAFMADKASIEDIEST
jgi:hypothetical protein